MRAVAGPRRWVGVLILSGLTAGVLVLVSRLLSTDAALLAPLSARLPFATAGTVLSPVLSGILGVGAGLAAGRGGRATDGRLRSLVLMGVAVCLVWMTLVSAFWFLVQAELMTLLVPGPGASAGVGVLSTLLVPSTVVIFGAAMLIAVRVRTATRQVAVEGHVQTVHSRGLPTNGLVLRRVMRHTLPTVLTLLIIEFLALYAGSLTVQSALTSPAAAAALPPVLPPDSLPFVLGAALLCIIGLIVVGAARVTTLWGAVPPEAQTPAALPSMRFRSTDFLDIRDLRVGPDPRPVPGDPLAGVSLTLTRGQALAVVGADDGASLLCLAVAGLLPPRFPRLTGSILLDGIELVGLSDRRFRQLRGQLIGVLAPPDTHGLDPLVRIGSQLSRLTAGHPAVVRTPADAAALLAGVGITDANAVLTAYPHQVSAATAQRVLLAAVLARDPELVIADHPTQRFEADDEARFLDLLHSIQRDRGFTLLLASDRVTNVLRCERVAVMHEGGIVEYGSAAELVTAPQHPQSRRLGAGGGATQEAPVVRDF